MIMNRNKGYILISLLLFFSVISLVLFSFHRYFLIESLKVQGKYENTRAYYLAESSSLLYYHKILHEVNQLADENFSNVCLKCFDHSLMNFKQQLQEKLQDDCFWNNIEKPFFKTYNNGYVIHGELISLDGKIHYKASGEYSNTAIIYYVTLTYPKIDYFEDEVSIILPKIASCYQGY